MEKKLNNFLTLKADIIKCFINRFPDKQQPLKYTTTKKYQYGQDILILVIVKQGLAFNIPIYYFSFFDLLYGLIKLNVKQASIKIKIKNGIPLILILQKLNLPIFQKLNLLMPSP